MKTTLDIPIELIEQARQLAKKKTKTETVIAALDELIRLKKREAILAKAGMLTFHDWEEARHDR
ncbi:MAG: type II toxin-antitoxin system VapB family antitoxin [Actinomycetota bacterium]|nr:type II toxin-antitoxin system VapB family antitoxin [Actinomycetota bacterium]